MDDRLPLVETGEAEPAKIIPLYLLPTTAMPRPHSPLALEQVADYRHLTCGAYSDCLNFAVRCKWGGFHCLKCSHFAPTIDDEEPQLWARHAKPST